VSDEHTNPEQPKPAIRAELPVELMRVVIDLLNQKARENTKSVYANTINLGITDVDVKIIFGEGQPPDWHTAVSMPWTLVKLLSYYLQSNLAVHEITNGTVRLSAGQLPETIIAPADMEANPRAKQIFEALQEIRTKLMDEQLPLHAK
jgi:hypothetical protein